MSDGFAIGLLIGGMGGVAASPLVRSAIAWGEWRRARREDVVTEALISRMTPDAGTASSGSDTTSREAARRVALHGVRGPATASGPRSMDPAPRDRP